MQLRQLALSMPDIKVLLEIRLLCEGFNNHQMWAKKLAMFFQNMALQVGHIVVVHWNLLLMIFIYHLLLTVILLSCICFNTTAYVLSHYIFNILSFLSFPCMSLACEPWWLWYLLQQRVCMRLGLRRRSVQRQDQSVSVLSL